jgi:uncharacterized membrane protein (DUF373 family)
MHTSGVKEMNDDEKFTNLCTNEDEPLLRFLHRIIRYGVRVLSVLMVMVIIWGVLDIIWVIYKRILQPPYGLLRLNDILFTFGAFLAVLIAIEIFFNITLYLRDNIIHIRLVVATALMAVARKVIVFDYKELSPQYIYATAAVVLALGITYWIVTRQVDE